jgi:LPXTG-motif cell wall-anchored protein
MQKQKQKKVGAFDIRNVIGILLGFYGIVLVIMGLVADPELAKTGGINANLIAGIGLIVVAGVFLLWARLRPLVVQRRPGEEPRA